MSSKNRGNEAQRAQQKAQRIHSERFLGTLKELEALNQAIDLVDDAENHALSLEMDGFMPEAAAKQVIEALKGGSQRLRGQFVLLAVNAFGYAPDAPAITEEQAIAELVAATPSPATAGSVEPSASVASVEGVPESSRDAAQALVETIESLPFSTAPAIDGLIAND